MIEKITQHPLIKKYQLLLIPLFVGMVCIVLLLLVIIPRFLKFYQSNKIIEETNQKNQFLNEKINTLDQIDPEIFKENVNLTLSSLPDDKDIPGAMGQILFLLGNSRLQLQNLSFSGAAAEKTSVESFQIRIEVSGSLTGLKEFTSQVNKAPRLMRVNRLEISGSPKVNDVQASITVVVFYQPLPTSIGGTDQPVVNFSQEDQKLLTQIQNARITTPQVDTEVVSVPTGKADPFE